MGENSKSIVNIRVDAGDWKGELAHNWNYIGTDECNYIHEPEGEALLAEFGRFAEKPYYVRPHHLFCTGNKRGTPKWGSTNLYTEDEEGNPIYDFEIFDKISDTILKTGCKPFVELGFMPIDLVDKSFLEESNPWNRQSIYQRYGWACPPKDYNRWRELIATVVGHLVDRYGAKEVETWYFELWNEPDLDYYWKGSIEEFCKLYDYTVAGIVDVLPSAYIGGPATTGPLEGGKSATFLDAFLSHCRNGNNYVTNEIGSRLDFITFHVKGGGFPFNLRPQKGAPSVQSMIKQLSLGLDIIEKYDYQGLEVVLSEADPDGWAAGGMHDNINLYFRNTSYYASFVASSFNHMQKLAEKRGFDVRPLTWAFVFPGERCFEGTRAFQTQGIDKPVLNMFRMYALMGDKKIGFTSDRSLDMTSSADPFRKGVVPEVDGFAAMSGHKSVDVLIYCHHDDWWNVKGECSIKLDVSNIPFLSKKAKVVHYRIDNEFSNACSLWNSLGRPYYPSPGQMEQLKARDGLEMLWPPQVMEIVDGSMVLDFDLPVHGISLIRIIDTE
ncbi:MAG: hypothetical protein GX375_09315 [Clostridiales bacterium]|nr:hypothetical protein [Clostridiales bacterium]